ncbi:uncharacterized protein LOC113067551 [Carassius auratus]|uniref:NAD(P)(+)--arginine ADP-ribosyltransferase n=1 Tax=Carassius auratus TaxID=7957 RepID=A0A6P6MG74_CARAU|nr:uncharacterized protein LOC113067551 [Carassius auratus]
MSEYKASCYALQHAVRAAKHRYRERIESHFQLNNSQRMWQGLRTICVFGNKSSAEVRADPSLADELNSFYGHFENNLSSANLPISASGSSSQISDHHAITVSEDEVRRALKRVNVRKAAGPDGISFFMKVFEGLIKNYICSSIPDTLDPLPFAYRPNLVLNSLLCNWIQEFLSGRPQVVKFCQLTFFRKRQQRPYTSLMISRTPVERLLHDHRDAIENEIFPLDMALNSVDDQYDGCTKEMKNLVKTIYLEKEMSEFWQKGEKYYKAPEDNLAQIHSVAIYVYTSSNATMYRNFTNAVYADKEKYKNNAFTWYSLHFLLTEAIQILKKKQHKCYLTYRGTKVKFDGNVLNTEVRFGSFASSSLNRKVAEEFGNVSCFEIYTCEGADIAKYSRYPDEREVLIPPYEMFKVTAVRTGSDLKHLWCDTVFTLKSSGTRSDLNCAVFQKTW